MLPASGSAKVGGVSLFSVDQPNVVIETIKAAEDGNGLIVRLYESQCCHRQVTLKAGYPIHQSWRTNLLEEAQEELTVQGNEVHFSVRPYQIVTIRVM
ncbi:hypothetical protein SDC9_75284 [bioreactor metagenome]|uniref:Glycosyl hydrolases family 38 C-terminal domain-containing protein n=1 Tax=bioreactor metagenome TaxID=1076179 RepID=A0A644YJU6_9ZZZZ